MERKIVLYNGTKKLYEKVIFHAEILKAWKTVKQKNDKLLWITILQDNHLFFIEQSIFQIDKGIYYQFKILSEKQTELRIDSKETYSHNMRI